MIFHNIIVGPIETNCYIFGDEKTGEVAVIDPGADEKKILDIINSNHYKVVFIILTHGHWDHISAATAVRENAGGCVAIHKLDEQALANPHINLSIAFGHDVRQITPDRILEDGDRLAVGSIILKVLHTPGHSPGSICLESDNIIFTGDTVFDDSIGRTDLPGGDYGLLMNSIKEKLIDMDDEKKIYPGHGPATTGCDIRKFNPFIRELLERR